MLHHAISRALAGAGGFRLVDHGVEAAPALARLSGTARGAVLWPMQNTAQAVWQLLAALDAGIVPLLLPPGQPPARLALLRARFPGFGLLTADGIDWPAVPALLDGELFLGLLTSGSTGEPKAIVTSAERLAAGARAIHAAQGLEALRSTGVVLPLAYSFACVNQLFWSVLMERALHLPGPLTDMAASVERIRASGVEMMCMVSHQVPALLRLGGGTAALDRVRCVSFAGSPFPMAAFDDLRALFPNARLINNYGCAEAMPRLSCTEVRARTCSVSHVGQPVGDIALRIAGPDASGPIEFRGSSSALGTIGPDGKLHAFGEWIPSGDLGRIDSEGLHVLGRHDQVVKIGGERLSLLDVERALGDFGASQAAVWMEPGERIVAALALAAPADLGALLAFLRGRLPRPLLPAEIYQADAWPLNANQKTDRLLLQSRVREGALAALWPVAPAAPAHHQEWPMAASSARSWTELADANEPAALTKV
ncbi:AMP-binding protein [Massilia niastensis]|uniref:AMP-binding protein n=1 Tax=Massilia niastensis TaxID=544911 RepID=UPI0003774822|nr:class I adenylate-forming enzyme family protein [Massilia niastensis]